MSLSSSTSSCIKLAVWIISMISAKRRCSIVSSLEKKQYHMKPVFVQDNIAQSCLRKGYGLIRTLNQLVLLLLLTLETPKLVSSSSHQHQISAQLRTSELDFRHQQSTREILSDTILMDRKLNDCRYYIQIVTVHPFTIELDKA